MSADIAGRLKGALLRIRGDHPFFGTLALFAHIQVSDDVPTAATDGRTVWFNPNFVEKLDAPLLCGLVAHELLHAALQHGLRRRERDPQLWNTAADIVVNGMVRKDTPYPLPKGAVEDEALAHLSVEEVYEQLNTGKKPAPRLTVVDLLPIAGDAGALGKAEAGNLQRHWRAALQQASAVVRRLPRGFGSKGLDEMREIQDAANPRVDWKWLLCQFLVSNPFDFGGFDRRFVYRKLYLDDMVGEAVRVAVCVDTSASIRGAELGAFMSEVRGIVDAYPQIHCQLFYADAALHGPHEFNAHEAFPAAHGGGGTSFVPFFNWLNRQYLQGVEPVAIYLTDGFGQFPTEPPPSPVMWVVSTGGLESSGFPFGQVVRMGT